MKYVIFNDVHHYSKYSSKHDLFQKEKGTIKVYLGDNYDLSNCKKKHIELCKRDILRAKQHFGIFVTGNHELNFMKEIHRKHNHVLFTHGDYIFWGKKKAEKYRSSKEGGSWFKRTFISPFIQGLRQLFRDYKIKDKAMYRAIEYAKEYDCKFVVVGHAHPRHETRRTEEGVTLIALPRGRNELIL